MDGIWSSILAGIRPGCVPFVSTPLGGILNYIILQKNMLWIADLHENEIGPNIKWNKVINEFDASYGM